MQNVNKEVHLISHDIAGSCRGSHNTNKQTITNIPFGHWSATSLSAQAQSTVVTHLHSLVVALYPFPNSIMPVIELAHCDCDVCKKLMAKRTDDGFAIFYD